MFRYQFFLQLKQSRKPESSTSDVESTILFSSFISKFRRMLFSTITSTVDIYKSLSIVPVIIQTYFTVTEKNCFYFTNTVSYTSPLINFSFWYLPLPRFTHHLTISVPHYSANLTWLTPTSSPHDRNHYSYSSLPICTQGGFVCMCMYTMPVLNIRIHAYRRLACIVRGLEGGGSPCLWGNAQSEYREAYVFSVSRAQVMTFFCLKENCSETCIILCDQMIKDLSIFSYWISPRLLEVHTKWNLPESWHPTSAIVTSQIDQ